MRILVIDAQGGGMGKQLVAAIRQGVPGAEITAVGTNSVATAAMRKAGADFSATGENAVVVACRRGTCGYHHCGRPAGGDHACHGGGRGAEQRQAGADPL